MIISNSHPTVFVKSNPPFFHDFSVGPLDYWKEKLTMSIICKGVVNLRDLFDFKIYSRFLDILKWVKTCLKSKIALIHSQQCKDSLETCLHSIWFNFKTPWNFSTKQKAPSLELQYKWWSMSTFIPLPPRRSLKTTYHWVVGYFWQRL